MFDKTIEQRPLTRQQLQPSLSHGKPCDPVDLGELPDLPGSPRPFQLEGVALAVADVQIAANGEGGDDLAAGLLDWGELEAGPGGDVEADLLTELTLGGGPWVLVIGVLALRDRPRAVVLACPKRPAGMADQHFGDTVGDPVQQETGAAFRHLINL
jgi:hypothetical protein